ncbi:uncharacterized protein Dana_GF21147 [Drosophila ananassae]|uniref:Uncharacterized protein n=1 Tax=Drosophila ananassae TaxID=7217 RepID=B3MQS9_DROAN|nr:uncharacterized protein LOC6503833 [Drosophila ananassae]EDV34134.1 uncharacterized protein Dana_GF21147 [Drosophila ananassae]
MEYSVAAFLVFVLALCLGHSVWAAPSAEDLAQFGELEKTIKELTNSILAMSGGASGDVMGNRNSNSVWTEDLQA